MPGMVIKNGYAAITWSDTFWMFTTFFLAPFVVLWSLITSPFTRGKYRTWRRVIGDSGFRFVTGSLAIPQIQYGMGKTLDIYKGWANTNKLPVTIDELGEDARLLWIGTKRTDAVVLYFHGGGFVAPLQDFSVSLWRYVQLQLANRNHDVGFAILNYSLLPNAPFPTQLRQAKSALDHLLALGVQPQHLQIVGDSAGGNLILQLVSHILHPLDTVSPVTLLSPLGGIYLMSPWVSITGDTGSHYENAKCDIIDVSVYKKCGQSVLVDLPDSQRPYVEAVATSESWFKGIDSLVNRILVTSGSLECLRDDIIFLSTRLSSVHPELELIVQKHAVHNDPYFDFMVGEKKLGELTPLIVDWLAAGF